MSQRRYLKLYQIQWPLERYVLNKCSWRWSKLLKFIHSHFILFQEFDEDELEAELDALGEELDLEEQEELDKQLLDVGPAVLPDVPNAVPAKPQPAAKAKKEEEDPDMAELAAWAS